MIHLIRGFKDILPGEVELWQYIERTAIDLFENFGFREIRVPIMERTELFSRSIGEDTDIVEKEMYTFPDRKGEFITLRPEATASVVRSYIQQKLYTTDPVQKLYTIGPMFRRERPQKGRYRQFYQIDAEIFGSQSPLADAQLIFMLVSLFIKLSVTDATVHINSLGCPECRPKFREALSGLLKQVEPQLCEDCVRRSTRNPLRVLDCKVPTCRDAIAEAPSVIDFLCPECREHFKTVTRLLDTMNVPYVLDKRLVRGLDYYTRTAFEIQTGALGAQNAIAGGGRYDSLVKTLGGPDTPAIGFAIGFDRLAEIVALSGRDFSKGPEVFIAALGKDSQARAFEWHCALSMEGISTEMDFSDRGLKGLMKRASRLKSRYVLITGEQELEQGALVLRNMATKEQVAVPVDCVVETVKSMILQ